MANTIVKGKIARVSAKPGFKNRAGEDVTLHSFQLEGKNTWYRTGESPIPAGVGQSVQFVADDVKVDVTTFEVVSGQVVQAPRPASAAASQAMAPTSQTSSTPPATTTGLDNRGYWDRKDSRDIEKDARYQAVSEPRMALSVATEVAGGLISTALTKDAISFGNAAKAKKLGLLASYTKELALELAVFIQDAPAQLEAFRAGAKPAEIEKDATSEVQE